MSESSDSGSPVGSPSYSSSPNSFSFSPDPKVAIPLPAPGEELKYRDFFRRNSIKNMVFLDDFGTD
jgi:hypothetical protein